MAEKKYARTKNYFVVVVDQEDCVVSKNGRAAFFNTEIAAKAYAAKCAAEDEWDIHNISFSVARVTQQFVLTSPASLTIKEINEG